MFLNVFLNVYQSFKMLTFQLHIVECFVLKITCTIKIFQEVSFFRVIRPFSQLKSYKSLQQSKTKSRQWKWNLFCSSLHFYTIAHARFPIHWFLPWCECKRYKYAARIEKLAGKFVLPERFWKIHQTLYLFCKLKIICSL